MDFMAKKTKNNNISRDVSNTFLNPIVSETVEHKTTQR